MVKHDEQNGIENETVHIVYINKYDCLTVAFGNCIHIVFISILIELKF